MTKITDAFPGLNRTLEFFPMHNNSPTALNPLQIDQFNRLGYVCPLAVYSTDEATANRTFFDHLMANAARAGHDNYSINGWHKTSGTIHDIVTESRITDYVADLLGPDVVCWGTHFFCKTPGDRKRVSYHQDASYWPLSPSKTLTVWLAIDDADAENGAMQVIPRSHLHSQIAFQPSDKEENNVLNQTVTDPDCYGSDPVFLTMAAGQISLHSDLLLHGSSTNPSLRRRCGLTMRFVPPEVRAHHGWNTNAVVCRGRDPYSHWIHHPRPHGEKIPKAS